MATTHYDGNAVLKDLTIIAEDTVAHTRPQLHPLICAYQAEDGAYTKIPVAANVPLPKKFEGERAFNGKDVNVVQTFNQDTYEVTIELDADLVMNSKAYTFESLIRETTMSAILYPDYLCSQAVINGATAKCYDGTNAFYGTTKKYANAGSNNINNTVSATGTTVPTLNDDFASAIAKLRTFKDNAGRLLNPMMRQGPDQFVIHCPAQLQQKFLQLINGSMIPITVPVTTSGTAAAPVATNVLQGAATVFADGYLDANSTSAWYLHYVGMPQRPFVFIENYAPQIDVLGFGSEYHKRYNKVMIGTRHRFVLGYYRFDRSIKVS